MERSFNQVDQAMKAEKDNAMDRCDLCEQVQLSIYPKQWKDTISIPLISFKLKAKMKSMVVINDSDGMLQLSSPIISS